MSQYKVRKYFFPLRRQDSLGSGNPTIDKLQNQFPSGYVMLISFPPFSFYEFYFLTLKTLFFKKKLLCEKMLILVLSICNKIHSVFLDYYDFLSFDPHYNLHNIMEVIYKS